MLWDGNPTGTNRLHRCWRQNVLMTFIRCWWRFGNFTLASGTYISKISPTSINRQLSPFKPHLAHSSIGEIYFRRYFRILTFTIRFGKFLSIFQMHFMKLGKYIFELLTNIFEQFNFLVSMHFLRLLSFQFDSDQMALLN